MVVESFWEILKNDSVYNHLYKTKRHTTCNIIGYIKLYDDHTRIQKSLGYKSLRQV
ncbi:IS3 family transposase [Psychrobacter sp. NG25]|uniref:IS3 family transposase n=1 Tax=Psychrobacter sp. NG25 TaxID=2782005 RepID=UPI0034DB220C